MLFWLWLLLLLLLLLLLRPRPRRCCCPCLMGSHSHADAKPNTASALPAAQTRTPNCTRSRVTPWEAQRTNAARPTPLRPRSTSCRSRPHEAGARQSRRKSCSISQSSHVSGTSISIDTRFLDRHRLPGSSLWSAETTIQLRRRRNLPAWRSISDIRGSRYARAGAPANFG